VLRPASLLYHRVGGGGCTNLSVRDSWVCVHWGQVLFGCKVLTCIHPAKSSEHEESHSMCMSAFAAHSVSAAVFVMRIWASACVAAAPALLGCCNGACKQLDESHGCVETKCVRPRACGSTVAVHGVFECENGALGIFNSLYSS
jgi:hypothetical protein